MTWPSGTEDVFSSVTANQTLTIVEGSSLSTDSFEKARLTLSPNPTNGVVSINNLSEDLKLKIYTILGKQLDVKNLSTSRNTVDLSRYPKGVYLFQFEDAKGNTTTKKVVLK